MSSDLANREEVGMESAVMHRYGIVALEKAPELCCPVTYVGDYLAVIPSEIKERDYGCGDPSPYVAEGEVVLDLGCGAGKLCYIACQIVGPTGKVIGVDMTPEMLALARKHQPTIAGRLGYDNVEFRRGRIQDLALNLERFDAYLDQHPIRCAQDLAKAEEYADRLRESDPLVASETVDTVVSNCVLNLVKGQDKRKLFEEIYRVLAVGGRAAISDIVSDEPVPESLQSDPELWSGCISGAFQEQAFVDAFVQAGFYGVEVIKRETKPWRVVEGIEFRSVTIMAHKGKEGPCFDHRQAVIYRGPFRSVSDDDGHCYHRGERTAVCAKTFGLLNRIPYQSSFYFVEPLTPVDPNEAKAFDCKRTAPRHPRETKGQDYLLTTESATCCGPDEVC